MFYAWGAEEEKKGGEKTEFRQNQSFRKEEREFSEISLTILY